MCGKQVQGRALTRQVKDSCTQRTVDARLTHPLPHDRRPYIDMGTHTQRMSPSPAFLDQRRVSAQPVIQSSSSASRGGHARSTATQFAEVADASPLDLHWPRTRTHVATGRLPEHARAAQAAGMVGAPWRSKIHTTRTHGRSQ